MFSIIYHHHYNIDLGVLNNIHPFDGLKYRKVYDQVVNLNGLRVIHPKEPLSNEVLEQSVDELHFMLFSKKSYILRSLELPNFPLLSMDWIEKKLIMPFKWGASGTLLAAQMALSGDNCWNLAGGYHHASRNNSEGFCLFNDICITIDELRREGKLMSDDTILVIDVDAHHGNGNAYCFMDDHQVTLLDIYNEEIYPLNSYTRDRIDINVPLSSGTRGSEYLEKLEDALDGIDADYSIAFVVAGTDVLSADSLGGLALDLAECSERDLKIAQVLIEKSIPYVFLAGGGYSNKSAEAMIQSVNEMSKLESLVCL